MEWFLINQNEHLGPFEEEVLHDLFKEGEIVKDSLLWREGWTDAQSYEDVFLLDEAQKSFKPIAENLESFYDKEPEENILKDDDLPPELPPEVMSFKDKVASIKSSVNKSAPTERTKQPVLNQPVSNEDTGRIVDEEYEYELEDLKPVKVDNQTPSQDDHEVKQSSMEESEEEIDVSEVFEYDYDVKSQEKKLNKIIRQVFIAVLTLVIVAPLFLYITNQDEIFSRPRSMSLEDYEKLTTNANDQGKDLKFAFSLATDKRTLWISTNMALEGEVFVNLKSKMNRTLGGLTEIKAKGTLEKRLITLSEFQFIQGTKFVDGFYDAEIYTVEDLSEPFYNRFFDHRERQFRYLNDVLITDKHPVEFEKLLEKRNIKKQANQSRFWEDLIEEYKTVRGITESIKLSIEKVFTKPVENWPESVAEFDSAYKNNFGVFFTSFILNVEKQYDDLIKKEFPNKMKIVSHYSKLKELAVDIGKESVVVMENLKSAKTSSMSREELQDLKFNSLIKFRLIIKECDVMIDKL